MNTSVFIDIDLKHYFRKINHIIRKLIRIDDILLKMSLHIRNKKKTFILNIYYNSFYGRINYKKDFIGNIKYRFDNNELNFTIGKYKTSINLLELSDNDNFISLFKKSLIRLIEKDGKRYKLNINKLLWIQQKEILSNNLDNDTMNIVKSFLIKKEKK